jgi:hypothetical protein
MEDTLPDAFGCPADEAIVESFTRALDGGGVDPACSRLQRMNDPTDDAAIIDPWFAARVSRKMRREPSELIHDQPEIISIHQQSPFGDLESGNAPTGNPVYGSGA